jgi:hypothetical protein
MIIHLQPPKWSGDLMTASNGFKIFLAGSIEMDKAEDWQSQLVKYFELYYDDFDESGYQFIIMNPRRDNWDASQAQSIKNDYFTQQVNWELDSLDVADLIVLYFDPNTTSPISLLELGIHKDSNIVVCCPEGFYRKGNVEIVCERYEIPLCESMSELEELIDQKIESAIPYRKFI